MRVRAIVAGPIAAKQGRHSAERFKNFGKD